MNSKTPANLDPKLKETYERVMGTSFTPATTPPTTPPVQTRPVQTTVVQEPEAPIAMPQPIQTPLPPIDVANPVSEMVQSPQMPKTGDPFKETVPPPHASVIMKDNTTKKKNFLTPALLIVGGLIFFVAYAIIWYFVLPLIIK